MNRVIKIQDFNNRATSKISNLKDRGILNLIRDFKIDLFYQKKKKFMQNDVEARPDNFPKYESSCSSYSIQDEKEESLTIH